MYFCLFSHSPLGKVERGFAKPFENYYFEICDLADKLINYMARN